MAVTYRSGADGSGIALGKQTALETPVVARASMTNVIFPVSASNLGPADEVEDSNLISSYGAAPAIEPGQEWAAGGATMRILPAYFHHILEGILNPVVANSVELTGATTSIIESVAGAAFGTIAAAKQQPPEGTGNAAAPANWPSKIKVAGGSATGTVTADAPITLKIVGLRRAGRRSGSGIDRLATYSQEETLEITSTGAIALETTKLWDTILSATWSIPTAASITGTTALTWDPDTHKSELKFQLTDPRHPGFTLLNLVGGRPDRVFGYIMSELSIAASNAGIDVTFNGFGTRYDRAKTVSDAANFDTDKHALETADNSYYTNPSLKSFPGWAGALAFGDINDEANIVKYSSIDLNINRNYASAEGVDGRKFREGVSQTDNRIVTFSPTSLMRWGAAGDTFKNYHQLYRDGTHETLTMRNLSYNADGRQQQIDWVCESAQIAEMPTNEFTGPGQIEEPLVFRALQDGTTPELVVTIYTKDALYSS